MNCRTQKNKVQDSESSLTIWMNSKEASDYLRVSMQTLWNMTSNGKIPFYKIGRSNRYRRDQLEALISNTEKRF